MLLLADSPASAQAVASVTTETAVAPCPRMELLPARARAAWELLGEGGPLWSWGPCGAPLGDGSQRLWLVVDKASSSQLDLLVEAAREGFELPHGLVCIALTGRGFHGRGHRPWVAERGNLHLTTYFSTDISAAEAQAALTMLPAVAVAGAIRDVSAGRVAPAIKWVNDVLVEGRKLAGVLTCTSVEGGRIVGVTFGIGVNVAVTPEVDTDPSMPAPVSLAEIDPSLGAVMPALSGAIVAKMERGLESLAIGGSASIFQEYRDSLCFLGEQVTILPDEKGDGAPIRGRALGLLPDLCLVIEGHEEPVRRGRIVSCRTL